MKNNNEVPSTIYHKQGGVNILSDKNDTEICIKEIKTFMNNEVLGKKSNLNIFIGSGCSTPTIPLMGLTLKDILLSNEVVKKEFVEYLNIINDDELILEKYLSGNLDKNDSKIVAKYDNFSNIEAFMTFIKSKISVERNKENKEKLEGVFSVVKEKFIETIPKYPSQEYKGELASLYSDFYSEIFHKRQYETSKLNVFTTNYDMFNEVAFENNNVYYSTGFTNTIEPYFNINQFNYRLVDERNRYKDKWQPTTKEANLYKLHGSINWGEKDGKIINSNKNESNVIIYPTILKHNETTQSPYSELFRELSIQLQKINTTLLIIGYGFGDDHINSIIFQNLVNEDFTLIIFSDIDESKIKSILQTYGKNQNLHVIGGSISDSENLKMHYFINIFNYFIKTDGNEHE